MFSSSVRRAALTTPQIPIVSLSSATPRAATSQALSHRSRSHQRRCSSSKPPSPADGSKGVSQRQTVPPTAAQSGSDGEKKESTEFSRSSAQTEGSKVVAEGQTGRSDSEKSSAAEGGKKATSRSGRRKGSPKSDMKDEGMRNVPSVPSTQHVAPGQICASSFFSLHRPISLTMAYPKPVTDAQFNAIFKPRSNTNTKPSEVISTLSSTLENLDSATNGMRQLNVGQKDRWNAERDEFRAAITAESYRKAETQHLDQPPTDSALQFSQHVLNGRYRPFNPPPTPVPMNTTASLAAGAEAAEAVGLQQKTYKAVLIIEESTDANGEVTYMAHSSAFVQDPTTVPTRFLERMKIRQERYEEYREQRSEDIGMEAISVKRQRKLKMKKHKYKKLMRRTRNLRRRLDRN